MPVFADMPGTNAVMYSIPVPSTTIISMVEAMRAWIELIDAGAVTAANMAQLRGIFLGLSDLFSMAAPDSPSLSRWELELLRDQINTILEGTDG